MDKIHIAYLNIPTRKVAHINEAVYLLRASDTKIVASAKTTPTHIYDLDLKQDISLIAGKEDHEL